MKIVFASNNPNKVKEIQMVLPDTIQLVSLADIGCTDDIPETAETLEGNAILKANYVTEKYGLNCFADDTGLEIDALQGEPGVYSARYAGEQKNAEDNMQKVLQNLAEVTDRSAQFKTVIALNLDGQQHLFSGLIEGQITTEKKGTNGFGYDPIFQAEGHDKTFAELTPLEKASCSHRARAVAQLVKFLTTY
ncbi:MAG: non-canonical purine NTP diphosphatase [Flavobacterium sp.]|nr:non-canonical purine NTP diphosphatase [Flavobacterium sp.]